MNVGRVGCAANLRADVQIAVAIPSLKRNDTSRQLHSSGQRHPHSLACWRGGLGLGAFRRRRLNLGAPRRHVVMHAAQLRCSGVVGAVALQQAGPEHLDLRGQRAKSDACVRATCYRVVEL